MMRALLVVTVVLAAIWGGWWVVGSRGAKAAAEAWLSAHGQYDALEVAGFPNRFDVTVTAPDLADPARGLRWRAPFAQVFAMSWKPWHLIAALPGGQVISLPDQEVTLDGDRLRASLLLVPGPDLALSELVVEGADLKIGGDLGLSGLGRAVGSLRAEGGEAAYRLGLVAETLTLSPSLAQSALGGEMAKVYLDAHASLSAPLDRRAGQSQPRLRAFDLTTAHLAWGPMEVAAKGGFQADAAGFAAGEVEIKVTGWRHLPEVLVLAGAIAPGFAPTLERGLEVMAKDSADPQVLTLPLLARDGRLSLGPLPLGPAPWWGE